MKCSPFASTPQPDRSSSRRRPTQRRRRPNLESLEDRRLLAAGDFSSQLPPPIVLGRTLATPSTALTAAPAPSYFVGEVQNQSVTITFTAYNEQPDAETGVLITDSLEPGVAFSSASQQPEQSGQSLAWSLGTIPGEGRASVSLTVSLANPMPLQLDAGAKAYATLDGGPVSAATAVAKLQPGNVFDPGLLAATPDADSLDPFIQEEAAVLYYSAANIFDFLHTQIAYNSYQGSVRGARGTLWSSAGNALDVASLGVALARASGIPAQYVEGTLPKNLAQAMIISMFPQSDQTAGYVPATTQTADPADDPALLSETETHFWLRLDSGAGMQDADPLIPGATLGQSFTSATGTFMVVPDAMRAKTEVKLNAEFYNQFAALFDSTDNGLTTTTVLDQSFNDVDLVGHPLTVGNFVTQNAVGLVFSVVTTTYEPYIQVGDAANPDPSGDEVLHGQEYQELLTNFPLGSQVLTGEFLDITESGPGEQTQTYERALLDRIGYSIRQNGGTPTLNVTPSSPPALSDEDLVSLNILPGFEYPSARLALLGQLAHDQASLAQLASGGTSASPAEDAALRTVATDITRYKAADFEVFADQLSRNIANATSVSAFFDTPRITMVASGSIEDPTGVGFSIDLIRESQRVLAAPGQSNQAPPLYNATRGLSESFVEGSEFSEAAGNAPISTEAIFSGASDQGIDLIMLSAVNAPLLDQLDISDEAKARISTEIQAGDSVIVPTKNVAIAAQETVGWYEIDPATGETVGVLEDGGNQDIVEYGTILTFEGFEPVYEIVLESELEDISAEAVLIPRTPGEILIQNSTKISELKKSIRGPWDKETLDSLGNNMSGVSALLSTAIDVLKNAIEVDPPVEPLLSDLTRSPGILPNDVAAGAVTTTATLKPGAVGGSTTVSSLAVTNQLAASWSSAGSSAFVASSLSIASGTVKDSHGTVVGTGAVQLSGATTSLAVSGTAHYALNGTGSLSFYGPAAGDTGVAGSWSSYSATVTGAISLQLTTSSLSVGGVSLPAGAYSITTTAATLAGSGTSTSPAVAGSVSINATDATVTLGSGTGSLSGATAPLSVSSGATLTSFNGSLTVTAAAPDFSVTLNGSAGDIASLEESTSALAGDQNSTLKIPSNIQTSLAGAYTLSAQAPLGWTVAIDQTGTVSVTPAPGLQAGTFPVLIIAQSQANPALEAQVEVQVHLTPTSPASSLAITPDPLLEVPYQGALLPTAFRATIHNSGSEAESFTLSAFAPPPGFTIVTSASAVTVGSGETAIVGTYLFPSGPLPAVGTQVAFTLNATDASNPALSVSQTDSFAMPEVDAVALSASPSLVDLPPGASGSVALSLTNVGNVAETIALSAEGSTDLTAGALAPLTLEVGQSQSSTLVLTSSAATPLNSTLTADVTAAAGSNSSAASQTVAIQVRIEVPGTEALAAAAAAADELGNGDLADRFNDLGTALTSLVQIPTSLVYQSQATAAIGSLTSQLANDPFLAPFTSGLTAAAAAIEAETSAADVRTATINLGTALQSLPSVIKDEAQYGFTLALTPDSDVVAAQAPETFDFVLVNRGNATATYDLAVSGLPPGVAATLSQNRVTIPAGGQISGGGNNPVRLTLTEQGPTLMPAHFLVTATAEGAVEINLSTTGNLVLPDESILVSGAVADPSFTQAGSPIDVTARIASSVIAPRQVSAGYTVKDAQGNTLFTSTPVPISLNVQSILTTVDLGTFDTTGFSSGSDTIVVTAFGQSGSIIPGAKAQATVLIGLPVNATLSTTPTALATGTATVTSTVDVSTQESFPTPLTLLGSVAANAPSTSVAIISHYAYESGTGGVNIVDISDPANPVTLKTFATDTTVLGTLGFNIVKIVDGDLYVATTTRLDADQFNLLVYSLADPENPQLQSNTPIDYTFLNDLLVNSTGTAAFVPTDGYTFSQGAGQILDQYGTVVAVDLSNPLAPNLDGVLFNNRGEPEGGDHFDRGGVLVNDQTAYIASTTSTGGDTKDGTGQLLVVNVADPAHLSVTGTLDIPGTQELIDVAVHGNRALVLGSTAGPLNPFGDFSNSGLTGNLTLTILDASDPQNPKIVGQTLVTPDTFQHGEAGANIEAVDLGNGQFAVSDTLRNGQPVLLLVDPSDPDNLLVGATPVSSAVHGMTISGTTLYASTAAGLSIYNIGPLVGSPVTVSVELPPGAAANIVPGSYSVPPSQVISGTDSDTLIWNRQFASDSNDYTFSWQSRLDGIEAGATLTPIDGASIAFVYQGMPGTLTLPGTAVVGVPIISLAPALQTTQPGAPATFDVRLANPTNSSVTYSLTVLVPDGATAALASQSVTVAAQGTADVTLRVTPSSTAKAGTESFTVTAESKVQASDGATVVTDALGTADGAVVISGPATPLLDTQAHGIAVQLLSTQATAGQGTSTRYIVRLTNTGSAPEEFSLSVTGLPAAISSAFALGPINILPGASNYRDVPLALTIQKGTAVADYPFTVTATSVANPSVQGSTSGRLTVTARGVTVSLGPGSGAPGTSFQLLVSNTGTTADTYNLALAGPAALVSSLSMTKVSLAPGAAQTVQINTGGINFAVAGPLPLYAAATSTADPQIEGMASARLVVPAIQSMTAEFSPPSQTLTTPGKATFVLLVHNTGNNEDAYSATIISTTGPVTATLIGPDGVPTQTVSVFRLPGLATGTIILQADLTALGTGTITVRVQSLTTGSIMASPTATLLALEAAGPRVVAVKRFGYHMMPTTLVVAFDQALDRAEAENPRNYKIIGPAGRRIRIKSAVYDATNHTVTLRPATRINIHYRYTLVTKGASPGALRNTEGQFLDSKAGGLGSNERTRLTWRNLVLHPRIARYAK